MHLPTLPFEGNTLKNRNKDEIFRQHGSMVGGHGGLVRLAGTILLGLSLLAIASTLSARSPAIETTRVVRAADLPREARDTLVLIKQGGPFPYPRDGVVFANREGRLPHASHGAYREYTVPTPGHHDRGARRIITSEIKQFWYTADHYRSFRQIVE